ncbi:MAG TPA: hypothetical protein VLA04_05030 [Verrucomicrobiae bacterium]|nr:hypothetical protein [Verrucomicrobiae bacterium]
MPEELQNSNRQFLVAADEKYKRMEQKAKEASRKAANQPVAKEIGDNNTNQYRKTGNSI